MMNDTKHGPRLINRDAVEAVQSRVASIEIEGKAFREIAARIVRKSAWWLDHPKGALVCPKDCERIREGRNGLELYSGNRFLVERAIRECAAFIKALTNAVAASEFPYESPISAKDVRGFLMFTVRKSVVSNSGEHYAFYGEEDDEFMHFGSHAICVEEFVDELWVLCECHRIWA